MTTNTILFVHGNFVNYQSWDLWVKRFEAKGYNCIVAAYPGRDKTVEVLRKAHPGPKLGELTIGEVIEHLARIINNLDEKPIIIGHSFGGLLTQILVHKGLAAAALASDVLDGCFDGYFLAHLVAPLDVPMGGKSPLF